MWLEADSLQDFKGFSIRHLLCAIMLMSHVNIQRFELSHFISLPD